MNIRPTWAMVKANNVVTLKADKTQDSPEIDELLLELGNYGKSIPYYAIYPADGGEPILMDGPITFWGVLGALRKAGPSKSEAPAVAVTHTP